MAAENVTYKEPSFVKSFISGGMGGVAYLYVGHPLDTVKVNRASRAQDLVFIIG